MLAMSGADAPPGIWDRIVGEIDGEQRDSGPGDVAPPALDLGGLGTPEPDPGSEVDRTLSTGAVERGRPPRRRFRWVAAAAAVAAALIAVLSIQVVRQNDRIDRLDSAMTGDAVRRAAEVAATAPGSRTVSLTSDSGAELASIVLRPNGTGYFVSKGLGAAGDGEVYQLWALVGDRERPEAISAGVLGRDPASRASGSRRRSTASP